MAAERHHGNDEGNKELDHEAVIDEGNEELDHDAVMGELETDGGGTV